MPPKTIIAEITDQIYDKLFDNVGLTEAHVPFDVEKITAQEVFPKSGLIFFQHNNVVYSVTVRRYYNQEYFKDD